MSERERHLRASIAANTRWATEPDRTAATHKARAQFMDRFLREVDPDGLLDTQERERRAENARKAYFQRLALKSAQSRAAKKASKLPRQQAQAAARAALARQELEQ